MVEQLHANEEYVNGFTSSRKKMLNGIPGNHILEHVLFNILIIKLDEDYKYE